MLILLSSLVICFTASTIYTLSVSGKYRKLKQDYKALVQEKTYYEHLSNNIIESSSKDLKAANQKIDQMAAQLAEIINKK